MRRREFIVFAAGAAALTTASRLPARAQEPPMPLIGFLDSSPPTPPELNAFYDGLRIEGLLKNRNAMIEYRSAAGEDSRLPALAADLVSREVTLIVAAGTPAAVAARNATTTIPIVFAVESDPVRAGLVTSLNRPGGNVTGVTNMTAGLEQKRLQFLHELIPSAANVALLVNPTNPNVETQTKQMRAAAARMDLHLDVLHARDEADFDAAFAALARLRCGGLVIGNDELFVGRSAQLAALTVRQTVAAIFEHRAFALAGGLMGYGTSLMETYHQTGIASGFVLKGAKTSDLPVFQADNLELFINLKTARSLGVTIPPALLGRADGVME
jgi:putative tryptophan/tyrosine transport system substrate-binding protein